MADLSAEICGIRLRNPVLPAAGPPVRDGQAMIACAEGGAGGLVSKTISVQAAQVPAPNMAEIPHGFLNSELWSELPPEQWIEGEYALARSTGLPLIISLGYTAEEIALLAPLVKPYADALELSTHYIGEDPAPMMAAIRAAKEAVEVPVLVKLSPSGREIAKAAELAQKAGADGIVAINSFGPCLAIDVETGMPLLGSREGYGWLSGPALKPLAVRCVFDVARAVDLPIIGVGGVARGVDAIEMFMVGASAVQVCTAAILHGPQTFGRIAAEIGRWLDEHGYTKIADIQGLAIRRIKERRFSEALHPQIDTAACNGCGLCEISCPYHAIHVTNKKANIIPSRCTGCGLCVTRCRSHALSWPI